MLPLRSNFSHRRESRVILITDLNDGGMSVTNDIERVVEHLAHHYADAIARECGDPSLDNVAIIYCDSTGRWDGIETQDNVFRCFVPIGSTGERDALDFARKALAARPIAPRQRAPRSHTI
jgi:hypothetical protein